MVDEGVFWLVTPCGQRFFSLGINAMEGGEPSRLDKDAWLPLGNLLSRSRCLGSVGTRAGLVLGFNTAGGWSLHPIMLQLPVMPYLELGRGSRFHWFDPLHPATGERMRELARQLVVPYKGNPFRIGYFTDNEVGWWNGPLFTYYLKQPATNYTNNI